MFGANRYNKAACLFSKLELQGKKAEQIASKMESNFECKFAEKVLKGMQCKYFKTRNLDDSLPAVLTGRVIGEARNMKGGGLSLFLQHTNLQPKYLNNDYIKMCVKKVELF